MTYRPDRRSFMGLLAGLGAWLGLPKKAEALEPFDNGPVRFDGIEWPLPEEPTVPLAVVRDEILNEPERDEPDAGRAASCAPATSFCRQRAHW